MADRLIEDTLSEVRTLRRELQEAVTRLEAIAAGKPSPLKMREVPKEWGPKHAYLVDWNRVMGPVGEEINRELRVEPEWTRLRAFMFIALEQDRNWDWPRLVERLEGVSRGWLREFHGFGFDWLWNPTEDRWVRLLEGRYEGERPDPEDDRPARERARDALSR